MSRARARHSSIRRRPGACARGRGCTCRPCCFRRRASWPSSGRAPPNRRSCVFLLSRWPCQTLFCGASAGVAGERVTVWEKGRTGLLVCSLLWEAAGDVMLTLKFWRDEMRSRIDKDPDVRHSMESCRSSERCGISTMPQRTRRGNPNGEEV